MSFGFALTHCADVGAEAVGPEILAGETWATAAAAASACVAIVITSADIITCAIVAIVRDFFLEVCDGGHEGLDLCHRVLVLLGGQSDVGEVLL